MTSSTYLSQHKLSDYKAPNRKIFASQEGSEPADQQTNRKADNFNFTDDEKFGLLSAFLDDEVSDEERCLVSHWLKSDASLQATYQQQLRLRAALKLLSDND